MGKRTTIIPLSLKPGLKLLRVNDDLTTANALKNTDPAQTEVPADQTLNRPGLSLNIGFFFPRPPDHLRGSITALELNLKQKD